MEVKRNGFYLIKNEFFDRMQDSSLPNQKYGRPMYYSIPDKFTSEILWVIPMTTKLEKVKKIIEKFGGEEKCKGYVMNVSEKNSAFNIYDIFPIARNDIERAYLKNNTPYILENRVLIKKVEKKAIEMVRSKMTKEKISKNEIDVKKIYQTLSEELKIQKQKEIEPTKKKNPLLEKIQAQRDVEKKKHNL